MRNQLPVLIGCIFGLMVQAVSSQPIKVYQSQEVTLLLNAGAESIADYDDFSVLEFPPPFQMNQKKLEDWLGSSSEIQDSWDHIVTPAGPVDPQSFTSKNSLPQQPFVFLLQFSAPPKQQWIHLILQTDAKICGYWPHNTIVLYGDSLAFEQTRALAQSEIPIRWIGPILPEWKLSPPFLKSQGTNALNFPNLPLQQATVVMVEDPKANLETFTLLGLSPPQKKSVPDSPLHPQILVDAAIPSSLITALVLRPDVMALLPAHRPPQQTTNELVTIPPTFSVIRDRNPEDVFTDSGQSRVIMTKIQSGNYDTELRLQWLDAPGSLSGNIIINNLEMDVVTGGQVFRVLSEGINNNPGPQNSSGDRRQRVVRVVIPGGSVEDQAIAAVRIRATSLGGQSVSNNQSPINQDFTLLASNIQEAPQEIQSLPFAEVLSITDDQGTGNGNGGLDPGESHIGIRVRVENGGNTPLAGAGLSARLVSLTPGVRVIQGTLTLPLLNPSQQFQSPGLPFQIALDPSVPCSGNVNLRLDYVRGATRFAATPISLPVGSRGLQGTASRNNINLIIDSAFPNTVQTTIPSTISSIIDDIEVEMNLNHTFMGDLIISLRHPDGTSCTLFNRRGGSGDNMLGTVFVDSATTSIAFGRAPFSGQFRPEQPLNVFRGKPSAGPWQIIIEDREPLDGGVLNAVSIRFFGRACTSPDPGGTSYALSLSDFSPQGPFSENLGPLESTLAINNLGARIRNNNGLGFIGLQVNAVATTGPSRNFGVLENENFDLPYSAVGPNRVVRARYSIAYAGPGDSASSATFGLVPNFRLRAGMRFMHSTVLEVLHNAAPTDPKSQDIARELGPSKDLGRPSIYKVDYDPARVPQVLNDPQQGIQRAFEVFAPTPDFHAVQGTLFLVDSSIGTYRRPDLLSTPQKVYGSGGQPGNSDFDNPTVLLSNFGGSRAVLFGELDPQARSPEPGLVMLRAPTGVTINTLNVDEERIGLALVDFLEGNLADQFNQTTRMRIAPEELYVATFRVRSSGNSEVHPYMRFRMRTLKFQWNLLLEINGARAVGSIAGQNLGVQVLPGLGNLLPGNTPDGHLYHLFMPTPMDSLIRNDRTGSVAQRFPRITALPGPGSNESSLRDIKLGWDIIDSLSFGSKFENEAANNTTLNRIEIRRFTNPRD